MSYVDQHLMAGERVVYRSKLHWILFAGPVVFTAFFLLLAIPPLFSRELRAVSIVFLVLALVAGLVLLARYLLYRSSEFAVTNKRVLIKVALRGIVWVKTGGQRPRCPLWERSKCTAGS